MAATLSVSVAGIADGRGACLSAARVWNRPVLFRPACSQAEVSYLEGMPAQEIKPARRYWFIVVRGCCGSWPSSSPRSPWLGG